MIIVVALVIIGVIMRWLLITCDIRNNGDGCFVRDVVMVRWSDSNDDGAYDWCYDRSWW